MSARVRPHASVAAFVIAHATLLGAAAVSAQEADEATPAVDEEFRTSVVSRPNKGIDFASADGVNSIDLWFRAQFRYSTPFEANPRRPEDFQTTPGGELEINRARLKARGSVLSQKLGYYLEQELAGDPRLLDFRLDLTQSEVFRLRFGQYKVLYNRERVDSSGTQQFADRSIVTRAFTLDRQRGITAAGRVGAGTAYDAWYFLGLMQGHGRDPQASDDDGDGNMWLARYQWNFAGDPLPFYQSDFEFRSAPSGTLAFAATRFTGPYTRFSSEGGGQLDGFDDGVGDRYDVEQWLQEFAWKYDGWSVQQEYHVKRIEDRVEGRSQRLEGYYAQLGKAWSWIVGDWQRPVEVALRLAKVDQDVDVPGDTQRETTVAVNLYFAGHDNKLTFDVSRLSLSQNGAGDLDDVRWRLQWDVSF